MNGVRTFRVILPVIIGFIIVCTPTVKADKGANEAKADATRMFPVDQMIRQAAENVSRRYNLNEEQKQLTVDMFEQRVWEFLEDHEDEIWPLVRDLGRYQLNPNKKMDPNTSRRIGKAIRPIFEDAQKSILEANDEWRGILNEDQKKLHDYDLKEMGDTFKKMDRNFIDLEEGRAFKAGIFPQQPDKTPKGLRDFKKPIGTGATKEVISENPDFWTNYVRKFIEDYELDKAQIETANSILRDIRQQANDYKAKRKGEYDMLSKLSILARKSRNTTKLKEIQERRRELNKPISRIFDDMVRRLKKLPRPAQIRQYEAKQKKAKDSAQTVPAIKKTGKTEKKAEPSAPAEDKNTKPAEEKGKPATP